MYIERIFYGRATSTLLSATPEVILTVFAIGMALAVKYHYDVAIQTRYWCVVRPSFPANILMFLSLRSSNVSIGWREFHIIELAALQVLDWNLNVSKQAFELWMSSFAVHQAVSDTVDYSWLVLLADLHLPLHRRGGAEPVVNVPTDDNAWEHFLRTLVRSCTN